MLTTILIIIGILLILYSIFVIKKDLSKDRSIVEDLSIIEARVKDYHDLTEEIILDFDRLIDTKLDVMKIGNNYDMKIANNEIATDKSTDIKGDEFQTIDNEQAIVNEKNVFVDDIHKELEIISPIHKKILELNSLGLTKIEIAKTLNKGVREIDIILNLYDNSEIESIVKNH